MRCEHTPNVPPRVGFSPTNLAVRLIVAAANLSIVRRLVAAADLAVRWLLFTAELAVGQRRSVIPAEP